MKAMPAVSRPEAAARPDGEVGTRASVVRQPDAGAVLALDRPVVLETFQRVLAAAVGALPADVRLRLAAYYVQGLTLAHIGRLMGEHESSVSRKLDRTRRELRDQVERTLREEHRFSDADLAQCYAETSRLGTMDVGALLNGARAP